jgi:hypothetical protein
MHFRMTTLERAFELASTGEFDSISGLKHRLSHEGYVVEQLTGPVLLTQIKSLMQSARDNPAPTIPRDNPPS